MTVPSLNVFLPFPFYKVDSVTIHPSSASLISDVVNLAIQLSKEENQIIHEDYGLFLSGKNMWFLPEARIETYKEIFENITPNQCLYLIPKKMTNLFFHCLNYRVKVTCGLEQKLLPVVLHAVKSLSSQLDSFFTGNEWVAFTKEGELDNKILVKDALSYGNSFLIRRKAERLKETNLPVFHENLCCALARDGPKTMIPSFINSLFNRIEHFIKAEGIFRKSGGQTQIEQTAFEIDETTDKNEIESIINSLDCVHATSVLKYYFRNLKDPIIPFHFYHLYERIIENQDLEQRKFLIKQVLNALPEPNFHILARFVKCLTKVLENSESNKMNLGNLAICVAAVLIRNPDDQTNPLKTQTIAQQIITDLIDNDSFYFRQPPIKLQKAVCLKDITHEQYLNVKKGEIITIISDNPNGADHYYYAQLHDKSGYVLKKRFKLIEEKEEKTDQYINVKEDLPFKVEYDTHNFINHPSLSVQNTSCESHLQKLNKQLTDKTERIKAIMEQIEKMDQKADIAPLLEELNILTDTSFI